jgi:AraC-like DNA-binding protein
MVAGMLKSALEKLETIAHACGFSDTSYFTRLFSKRMGMPPGRYRAESVRDL